MACRCGCRPARASPTAAHTSARLALGWTRRGLCLVSPAQAVPRSERRFFTSELARHRIISFPSPTTALKELTSKHMLLLLSWQKQAGLPAPPSARKGRKHRKTQLESRDRYYFTSTGTGPLPRVKPWARGWDCDVRGCGPCEPLQTCFLKCSARLGAETVGAQRGFLEEATPKSTLQGGREEGREKKIQAEGTA